MHESDRGKVFFGSLEALRGIAALLVALYHAAWLNPVYYSGIVRNSYLMVDMFFVLSGFVMYHGYGERLRTRRDLQDFFVLRLGRLYPLHIAMLAVFVLKEVLAGTVQRTPSVVPGLDGEELRAVATNVLLVHALGLHDTLTFNTPSWSISTEFYTYILFAALVAATMRWQAGWRFATFVVLAVASGAVLLAVGRTDLNVMYDYGWFRCTMSFFLGAASALVYARLTHLRSPTAGWVASIVASMAMGAAVLLLELKTNGRVDFVFVPLMAVLVLSLAVSSGQGLTRWLNAPVLAYLGRTSYSIYMVHFLLASFFVSVLALRAGSPLLTTETGQQIVPTTPALGGAALLAYVAGVLLLSHITFTYIEEPFRRWSRGWVRARHGAGRREGTAGLDPGSVAGARPPLAGRRLETPGH